MGRFTDRDGASARTLRSPIVRALLVALVAVLATLVVVGAVPLGDSGDPPEPRIESVSVVDAGCHDEVRGRSVSSSGGLWVGTINETSVDTVVSAEIHRASRPEATVAAYRVQLETHNTSVGTESCPGRIVYRVEYDAPSPDAADAVRVERYIDGRFQACGWTSSGPDTGCLQLYEDRPVHWSNGSVTYPE
ncbi:hypothetical protein [Halovivax cerinus]|uniref:Archaeal Type IV pilin N-terminal domain-containing protein n=1 Tax=Halovivax cerinus TaxID=1487865 RepID=A0ABD5NQ80_9EURY|nr:hypothetical protein [Halovivax cerinus]